MTRVSIEWKVEELSEPDAIGRRQCIVVETDHRSSDGPRTFGPMPGYIVDAFVRVRRARVAKEMKDDGAFAVEDHFSLPPEMKE